jgi:hypothetical protein
VKPLIEAFALRNCMRRKRSRHLRFGMVFEWRSKTAEEFDRNRERIGYSHSPVAIPKAMVRARRPKWVEDRHCVMPGHPC